MYTPADLEDGVLEDVTKALAWSRFILRDTIEPFAFLSTELIAMLRATSVQHDGSVYYRPHVVAATLVRADPERAITESIDNASKTKPDPDAIAARILRAYSWIDDQIDALTGRTSTARSFQVVF